MRTQMSSSRLNLNHRIMGGALAARALSWLGEVLNSSILEELRAGRAGRGELRPVKPVTRLDRVLINWALGSCACDVRHAPDSGAKADIAGGPSCANRRRTASQQIRLPIASPCYFDSTFTCCSTMTGNVKANVEPWPGCDSTQILPPCISMIRLDMASPNPVPPFLRVMALSACWNS
jgi:hypothetical protein